MRLPLLLVSLLALGTSAFAAPQVLGTKTLVDHGDPSNRYDVVFVGDGFSDRCGAESADRVFARDSLASYLDKHGHAYEAWDDFTDVMQMLGFDRAEAAR